MLNRRQALGSTALALVVAAVPAAVPAATQPKMVACQNAIISHWNYSTGALVFDLPDGCFVIEHPSQLGGLSSPYARNGNAYYAPADLKIYPNVDIEVPQDMLDAALALHAAHQRLTRHYAPMWNTIRLAHHFPTI